MEGKYSEDIAKYCVIQARLAFGDGWKRIAQDAQWELVHAQILRLSRDEESSVPEDLVPKFLAEIEAEARKLIYKA